MKISLFLLSFLVFTLSYAQPPNDNCSGAVSLTVNPYGGCSPTSGTVTGATQSPPATACYGDTPHDDVWYKFTAINDSAYIKVSTGFDTDVEVLSSCTAQFACLSAPPGQSSNLVTGLTVGNTYYIRIYTYTAGANKNFNVCVTNTPVKPPNDNCSNATNVTINPNGNCNPVSGYVTGATQSGSTPCYGNNNDDVWYKFTAINDSAYISVDADFEAALEVLDGCSGTELACASYQAVTVGVPQILPQLLTGLIIGHVYYYRIYYYFSGEPPAPEDGNFITCVTNPVPPPSNAACPGMAPLCTNATTTYQAEAGATSAMDQNPGNNYGCLATTPSPTWFYFKISAAGNLSFDLSATFDIDYAIWGPYNTLANAESHCNNLPAPNGCSYSASAVEQADITSVVAGKIYIMLITNFANVPQTITVTASPTNTATTDCSIVSLPIELDEFTVFQSERSVKVNWSTASELNNDYFEVEKTLDGQKWSAVAKVKGAGTSNIRNSYNVVDENPYLGLSYYRLKQTDINGVFKYSKTVSVDFKGSKDISIYPQPAKDKLTVVWDGFEGEIIWMDFSGKRVVVPGSESGNGQYVFDVSQLMKGMYFIKLSDGNSMVTKKVIIE